LLENVVPKKCPEVTLERSQYRTSSEICKPGQPEQAEKTEL